MLMIRQAQDGDLSLIMDSWLKTLRNTKMGRQYATGEFFRVFRPAVERIIENAPDIAVYVDEEEDSSDEDFNWVLGWICGDRQALRLDFVYTKWPLRNNGIATDLIDYVFSPKDPGVASARISFSSWTDDAKLIKGRLRGRYNPYSVACGAIHD